MRQRHLTHLVISTLLLFGLLAARADPAEARKKNGFDLSNASVPVNEILAGGPPRDGIPSIDRPAFVPATKASFLADDDRIIGLKINGTVRAYPIKILNWHEIVNDRVGSQHFVVTYCPLCGSGMVFASNAGNGALVFGVSGLLYNSDMLLYDRNTESLWSQIRSQAISGRLQGTELPQLPAQHTTWGDWRADHPDSEVLSDNTGFGRDYDKSPYAGYERSRDLYFRVANRAPKAYHPKALVLGLEVDGVYKAYPFKELTDLKQPRIVDTLDGKTLTIHWNEAANSAHATDAEGNAYPGLTAYWFAWYAFHPDTLVFRNDR